jgi:hypothetical protein
MHIYPTDDDGTTAHVLLQWTYRLADGNYTCERSLVMPGEEPPIQSELDPPNQWEQEFLTNRHPDPGPTLPDVGGSNGARDRLNPTCIIFSYLITLTCGLIAQQI